MIDQGSLFDGATYSRELDGPRLSRQFDRVKAFMLGHAGWYTAAEVAEAIGLGPGSVAAVGARLRDLRKAPFGSYTVETRRRKEKGGTWEYHVSRAA